MGTKRRSFRRVFLPNLVVVWIAAIAPAQVNHTRQGTAKTLRVASHLVTVNAVVEDKSGNPVTDLKPSDFEILDGRQAQKLSFFLKYSDAPPAAVQSRPPNTYTNVVADQGTTPPSVTIILFDTLNSHKTSQGWGMEAVRKFLRQIQPGQHVGIYVLGDDLKVIHDFTQDDSDLVQELARYHEVHTAKGGDEAESGGEISELDRFLEGKDIHWRAAIDGKMPGPDKQSILQDNYLTTLSVLQVMARHLVGVPGRKTLIWVSDAVPSALLSDDLVGYEEATGRRFGSFGGYIRGEIEDMVRLMNENGIAVCPVSSEGLSAMDLDFHFSDKLVGQVTPTMNVLLTPSLDEHLDMAELAKRTGGRAFYNCNDIETGIEQAVNDERFSYSLGYYPDLKKWDGKWRKI
jgi:VWFA-related protein